MLRKAPPLESVEVFVAAARGGSFRAVARDMADIFLAIRIGREAGPALPVRSPVNLFRELFQRLSGDARLLGTREPDASYKTIRSDLYRFALDGAPLPVWEKIPTDENGVPLDR